MHTATCDTEFDALALTEKQARERVLAACKPSPENELIGLTKALGRVLANDVKPVADVPPHRDSAMDGYALRAEDQQPGHPLEIVGRSFAGHPFTRELGPGQCVQIMTGAGVPKGADTVVQQELTRREGNLLFVEQALKLGANIRFPGEDIRRGDFVLRAGRALSAADLGLLASVGLPKVLVHRLPRVAFFSTGDELRGVGEPLGEGEIYDSNRYVLHGLLQSVGVESIDMGRIPDQREAVEEAMHTAAEQADVVLTTGGASVGEADYVTRILRELGQAEFWKIAIKPGKPLNFGRIGKTLFFGLPGNPVSAMATFGLFVAPGLRKIRGENPRPYRVFRAITRDELKKRPGRTDFQRGILHVEADGTLSVTTTGMQGSHMLTSMSRADCFIRLPRESGSVPAGGQVDVIPFSEIF